MQQTVGGNHALHRLVAGRCCGRVCVIQGLATLDCNSLHTVRPYKEREKGTFWRYCYAPSLNVNSVHRCFGGVMEAARHVIHVTHWASLSRETVIMTQEFEQPMQCALGSTLGATLFGPQTMFVQKNGVCLSQGTCQASCWTKAVKSWSIMLRSWALMERGGGSHRNPVTFGLGPILFVALIKQDSCGTLSCLSLGTSRRV